MFIEDAYVEDVRARHAVASAVRSVRSEDGGVNTGIRHDHAAAVSVQETFGVVGRAFGHADHRTCAPDSALETMEPEHARKASPCSAPRFDEWREVVERDHSSGEIHPWRWLVRQVNEVDSRAANLAGKGRILE